MKSAALLALLLSSALLMALPFTLLKDVGSELRLLSFLVGWAIGPVLFVWHRKSKSDYLEKDKELRSKFSKAKQPWEAGHNSSRLND